MAARVSTDAKQRKCTYCDRTLVWRANGERMRDGSWVRLDERGLRWAGRRCPDCERARVWNAVRCDGFERAQVVRRLEADGFEVAATTLPLTVSKNNELHRVSVRRAYLDNARIVVEDALDESDDLVALVFTSVRVMPASQLLKMGENLVVHAEKKTSRRQGAAAAAAKKRQAVASAKAAAGCNDSQAQPCVEPPSPTPSHSHLENSSLEANALQPAEAPTGDA